MPQDFSPVGRRVLLEVARSGSFSAAARVLVQPEGVRVVAVRGEPHETRRLVLARGAAAPPGAAARVAVETVADALRAVARRPRP